MIPARLYQQGKPATQSGRARAERWVLEFESRRGKRPDPVMGWAGGAETLEQVRLFFPSREAAEAYAARHGLAVEVVPPPARRLILKSYADNFR
ncbi:MAG: ETC complex I subunit [Sphingomonadaceae bacterium]|uniref:NADH dehydrogenase ubiquinone Fe-S protein 4 n=1 Tax=Thermaurantiacus sp. TaxID=2820283 RepID=UPI00298EE1DF|nr:NADH dehydrogenase ubiquinone Fe-S protein 4 [Thermaurantiacus sp.]MCS6987526.1 ETC complex I subunit [Sphingomonadaceae bacterium]MDW8415127.1 NADH dehydrogenase ubiquinone Fe-S protein 4 [Thermaurantiacus sp.]